MHVVVTAGHVDHGKSTLVRALTGMDPDRLEEERRRGLSIQLGYCWTTLPGAGDVAFVDVPGHERFIGTTLSGMGPAPVAMLVVAADDPWMPQAAEHLAALDLLGVRHGVLVVTRSDLVDPGPALARARQELDRSALRGAPAVTVSGRTGAGLDTLRRTLADVLTVLPSPDPRSDVRLWVDRRFHVHGTGTVVTGTLSAGTLTRGDRLSFDGREVRIRGIEALGAPVPSATGPARVALVLAGRIPEQLGRGSALVSPGAFEPTSVVDVRLSGPDAPPERPLLHVGATSLAVHVRPLAEGLVRLGLARPLPLRIGDRGLLRDPGSRTMWGLQVLDPAPPRLQRRGAATRRAAELATCDGTVATELARRGTVPRSLLRRIGAAGPLPPGTVEHGDWLLSPTAVAEARAGLACMVEQARGAMQQGVPVAQAARTLGLPDERIVAALVEPPLRLDAGSVSLGVAPLPRRLLEVRDRIAGAMGHDLLAAPDAEQLRAMGASKADLAALSRAGQLLRVAEAVVLMPGADDLAVERLRSLEQPFTVSQARTALGTSRRVVLPLLGHLDRTGRTVRLADDRRRLRSS